MYVRDFILNILKAFQETETTAIDTTFKWDINTTKWQALDQIGAMYNTPRLGLSDEDYRIKLIGVIAVNNSKGDIEDLIRVFKTITNAKKVRILNNHNGLFDVELDGDEIYNVEILNQIPAGGTGINHIYLVDPDTFTFDDDNLGFDMGELAENVY